ncbi:hypothetical protein [Streptomyces sp. NPDC056337]|uniref:hypothetical protein n=1 Tax=Streptomyces sp. NPDC056337 TaxID=3345787 RepID=UPI0035DC87BC
MQMRHEGIEQEIEVSEASVKHYERAGWTRVGDDDQALPLKETAAAKGRRRERGEN